VVFYASILYTVVAASLIICVMGKEIVELTARIDKLETKDIEGE
jgi:hypothetical protein